MIQKYYVWLLTGPCMWLFVWQVATMWQIVPVLVLDIMADSLLNYLCFPIIEIWMWIFESPFRFFYKKLLLANSASFFGWSPTTNINLLLSSREMFPIFYECAIPIKIFWFNSSLCFEWCFPVNLWILSSKICFYILTVYKFIYIQHLICVLWYLINFGYVPSNLFVRVWVKLDPLTLCLWFLHFNKLFLI